MNVVICAHNRPDFLDQILAVLAAQTVKPRVIVVDDSVAPAIQTYGAVDKYIWNRPDGLYHRVGKYNEALALNRGPTILLDDDCVPVGSEYIAGFATALERHSIVRGLFLDGGAHKLTPWFSTTNLGMAQPILFDPQYDGVYGYEDLDLEQEIAKRGIEVGVGDERTAVRHIGLPFSGDRDATRVNEQYYRSKWGF